MLSAERDIGELAHDGCLVHILFPRRLHLQQKSRTEDGAVKQRVGDRGGGGGGADGSAPEQTWGADFVALRELLGIGVS